MAGDLKVYRVGRGEPTLVGHLDAASGAFCYDDAYLSSSLAAPISCSLPLRRASYAPADAFPYFEGLVPEGAARRAMAAELHVRESDYLAMLAYCGLDCIGGLSITEGELPLPPAYEPIDSSELSDVLSRPEDIAQLNRASRLSLAGTQNKVGLALVPGEADGAGWYRPINSAASTHILKASSRDEISYFEYLCMNAARACGLKAAETTLLNYEKPVICSSRFDRIAEVRDGSLSVIRLHQEDFAQACGLSSGSKYAEMEGGSLRSIASFLRERSDDPIADFEQLTRLVCFNYLVGNCDNHLKNLSLLYGENWLSLRLAPAYDLVCTTWFPDLSREMGMAIDGVFGIDEVSPDNIRALSSELGVPLRRVKAICSELAERIGSAIAAAGSAAPKELDEVSWKADDLLEDIAPRRFILSRV